MARRPGQQLSQPGDAFPGAPAGIVTPRASSSQSGGQSAGQSGGQDSSASSSNWAGYAATGASGSFTSVSASWTQPTATCSTGSQYAAFWIGLDGYTSKTVEQIGTEAGCSGPNPKYYAWYEVYPGAGVSFANPISPGDEFTGTVTALFLVCASEGRPFAWDLFEGAKGVQLADLALRSSAEGRRLEVPPLAV